MPARHAALRDDASALLVRLFRDHGSVRPDEVASLGVTEELLVRDGDSIRGRYRLDLVENLQLFSDWPSGVPDEVLSPGETAAILYTAARRKAQGGRLLDLGCGPGSLALLLSGFVDEVVGTDINPRAVALAQMNARLNGIANSTFRTGNLYEPVANEQFDMVVCQPPFLPLPEGVEEHIFLHGGHRGDELAREILRTMARHLTKRGIGLIFSDWPLISGELLTDRIREIGLRAALFSSVALTPESYYRGYGLDGLGGHLASQGIVGIRQVLTVIEHGTGVELHEVLPQDWGGVGLEKT